MIIDREILFSKYRILKVLKKSGTGRVLLAESIDVHARRIVKEVPKDEEGLESLKSEVSVLKQIKFPGIPEIYEIDETEEYFYIVEELIEGRTLCELIEKQGVFSLTDAVFYGRQLNAVISCLHSIKPDAVLHLDIQPKNIMIHEKKLYLIDFGNAVYAGEAEKKIYIKGTPGFAAPEQYDGRKPDERTDLYGIGACICYMLTGRRGGEGITQIQEPVKAILAGCMAGNREDRFPSCSCLAEKLEQLWSGMNFEVEKQLQKTDLEKKQRVSRNQKSKRTVGSFAGAGLHMERRKMKRILDESNLFSIGILGIDKGEGVTSLAVGLATYLQEIKCRKTAMVEMNTEGEFDDIRNTYFGKNYQETPFEIFKINYYPGVTKGEYAKICNMGYDCMVTDFGFRYQKSMEDFLRCDKKIVLGSINLWKYRKYLEFYEYTRNFPGVGSWVFLLSGDEDDIRMVRIKHNVAVMNKEFFMNPYRISEAETAYYEMILE